MRRLRGGTVCAVAAITALAAGAPTWGHEGNPVTPLGSRLSDAYEQAQRDSGLADLAAGLTQPLIQGTQNNGRPARFGHFSRPFAEPTINGTPTTQKCLEHEADENGLMFDCKPTAVSVAACPAATSSTTTAWKGPKTSRPRS
jgi:hypothetical protein